MIADALKYLTDLARHAAAPHKLPVDDPRAARFSAGTNLLKVDLPVPPRSHTACTLGDVVELANRFGDGGSAPVVWYDHDAVVLVIDDDGHRVETASLALEESDVFGRLVELRADPGGAWMNPRAFVRLLRIELAGALPPVALLNAVRKVKFENGVTVRAENQKQRESLGKEITSKVEAEVELPEEVAAECAVWKTPGEADARFAVRCSVEVDPPQGLFRLLPLPDEVERVRDRAVRSLADRLAGQLTEHVLAYYGRP